MSDKTYHLDVLRELSATLIGRSQERHDALEWAIAALSAQSAGGLKMRSCWLVELFLPMGGNSLGCYHSGFTDISGSSRTTNSPHKAKKYNTKEQAETAIAALSQPMMGEWKAITHGFYEDAHPPGEVAVTDEKVEAALAAPFGSYSVSSFISLKSPENIRRLMRTALIAAITTGGRDNG